ncbi:MAG: RHS repeat-associated core domain-containing protein [Bacteroidales bacterium]|nr:RHS repeat-associated core domain-containing protein [Bacteroidales bacterium]
MSNNAFSYHLYAYVHTPVVSDSLVQVKLQAVTNGVDHPATLTVPASSRFSYLDTLTDRQDAVSTLYFYHPDHLGSSSWITTTNGTVKQHLHYLPWGEEFVNQRSSHFDGVRYTFSAKERDAETGLTYFGARYYSSDLSIWLSVDPMAAKYPSSSPYVYCADNPVKLTDPDGRWIPGLDEDGNVTYTAEKGDSFDTFNRQFECRDANGQYKDANGVLISTKIFNNAKLSTTGQIKEGAIIKGAHVKEATNGSSVLKGNWHKMNDSQKASQVMFALMYGANKGTTLPNGIYGVDLNDYIIGFYSKDGGTQYSNVSIPLKGGDKIVVDMWLAPSSTIEGKNGSLWVRSSVEWGSYNNAMSRYPARVYSAKNVNAQYPFVVILFSVPESKQGDFDNSLRK